MRPVPIPALISLITHFSHIGPILKPTFATHSAFKWAGFTSYKWVRVLLTSLLRSFLQDLNLTPKVDNPIEMLCDNTTAMQFTKNLKFHQKTKDIKRHNHFMRDAIKT